MDTKRTYSAEYATRDTILLNYEKRKLTAQFDLKVKQIFLTTLVLLNLAALAFVYRELVLYYPFASQPLIASAFIFGVLGALYSMRIHTCGIDENNVDQFVNPIALFGRALSYLLFAPVLVAVRKIDLTNYADAEEVSKIDLNISSENNFEFCMKTYGPNISNLEKYGLITNKNAIEFQKIYNKFKEIAASKRHYEKLTRDGDVHSAANSKIKIVEKFKKVEENWVTEEGNWNRLKSNIKIPNPITDPPDFTKGHVRFYHDVKESFSGCTRTGTITGTI